MPPLLMITYILVGLLVTIVLGYFLYLTIIYLAVTKTLYTRYDANPRLKYFTVDDFSGLKAEPLHFKTKNKKTLHGYIYTTDDVKDYHKVILFFHGIGYGHLAYTKEINRLVKDNNLAVIAYDNLGCGDSEGKSIKDLSWPLVDASYFLEYSKTDPRLANSEFILIGHSWGGFVAGNLMSVNPDPRIKKCIVMNGLPNIVDVSTRFTKGQAIAKLYYQLINYLKLGKYANQSTLKTLSKHRISALIIHGALDPVVPLKYVTPLVKYANTVQHIRPLIYADHHHFVYLSLRAEAELMDMQRQLKTLGKSGDTKKLDDYTKGLNYDLIGEQNEQLFATIKQFILRG